jgi:hypothetical protein
MKRAEKKLEWEQWLLRKDSLILFGIFWTKKLFFGSWRGNRKYVDKSKKGKIERKKWKHTYPPQVCLNHDWRLTKRERGRGREEEGERERERGKEGERGKEMK